MSGHRTATRIEWRLFLAAWLAYAFFHQGGGWGQNARFAMARAVVEEGRFAVDSFLFYSQAETSETGYRLVRTPIDDGVFRLRGARWAVGWSAEDAVGAESGTRDIVALSRISATGDLAFANGHFYPKQAPGTALIAVPAYFLIHQVNGLIGLDPDDWWVLTVNGWLTTALSVGLLSALGCVALLRVALLFWPGRLTEATWATLAFAFATLLFPYATILLEHNIVAVLLLGSFYFLLRARALPTGRRAVLPMLLAGLTAGYAAISAYIAVIPVVFLTTYLLTRVRRRGGWLWFGLGLAGPLLLLCAYNEICFGSPFTTGYHFQNPQSLEAGVFASVLGAPRVARIALVLVSPFCGLFFSSPVLLAGLGGWVGMWREGKRAEALLCISMLSFFLLFTSSYKGLFGGWGVGPRYLIPAVPFLALPLVLAFGRYFKITLLLTVLSALTMVCFTAVDVKSPVGLAAIARHPGRSTAYREPLTEYALPILVTGKAWPILNAQIDEAVRRSEQTLRDEGVPQAEAESRLEAYRERLVTSVDEGAADLPLALYSGPVSANPMGLYEGWWGHVFKPGEPELSWNSFNAGELLRPHSVWSLLPLLLVCGLLSGSAVDLARRKDRAAAVPSGTFPSCGE